MHKISSSYVHEVVRQCLSEDVGSGDLTASLTPNVPVEAKLVCRQQAIVSGIPFFNEVFNQLDPSITIQWKVKDGDLTQADQILCTIEGYSRSILTGERSGINLLQTLSGTATQTHTYVKAVEGTQAKILDTRKTIPGLRIAQKWAVVCGGGVNHRIGLFDGILIKENHISSSDSIADVLNRARAINHGAGNSDRLLCIEVETLEQLNEALDNGVTRVLLDNFDTTQLTKAVEINDGRAKLEASGGITLENVREIAETGVDYISIGAITKDLIAVDLSLRFTDN